MLLCAPPHPAFFWGGGGSREKNEKELPGVEAGVRRGEGWWEDCSKASRTAKRSKQFWKTV